MKDSLIKLTKDISLGDIKAGRITPEEAYKEQVQKWLFEPCSELINTKNTDSYLAGFSLLMMFFEPHGKYLGGTQHFNVAFEDFLEFIEAEIDDKKEFSKKIYQLVRCRLFHALNMQEILVDSINFNQKPIQKNPIHNGWIINVPLFLEALERYFKDYFHRLKDDNILKESFNSAFEKLVLEPLKKY